MGDTESCPMGDMLDWKGDLVSRQLYDGLRIRLECVMAERDLLLRGCIRPPRPKTCGECRWWLKRSRTNKGVCSGCCYVEPATKVCTADRPACRHGEVKDEQ